MISLLIVPLILLPGLMGSIPWRRGKQSRQDPPHRPAPIPRQGGIPMALALLGVACLAWLLNPASVEGAFRSSLHIVWATLVIAGLGVWNDYRRLSAIRLLLLQALVAALLFSQGVCIESFDSPTGEHLAVQRLWSGGVTVLWLVSLTNLVRIMDAMTGLAAGVSFLALGLLALAAHSSGIEFPAHCAIGMIGAVGAFLVYNLPPTRIRLGGGGASLLGFLIASLTVLSAREETILAASVAPFVIVLLLISGAALAVLRRRFPSSPVRPAHHKPLDRPAFQRGVKPHAS